MMKKLLNLTILLMLGLVLTGTHSNVVEATYGGLNSTRNVTLNNLASNYYLEEDTGIIVGKNLFDYLSNLVQGGINSDGTDVITTNKVRMEEFIPILPNTQYTYSAQNQVNGEDLILNRLTYYDSEQNLIVQSLPSFTNPDTFTTNANARYVRLTFQTPTSATLEVDDVIQAEVQLEEGSSATTYEPVEYLHNKVEDGIFTEYVGRDFNDEFQSLTGWSASNVQGDTRGYFVRPSENPQLPIKLPISDMVNANVYLEINSIVYPTVYYNDVTSLTYRSIGISPFSDRIYVRWHTDDIGVSGGDTEIQAFLQSVDVDFRYELLFPIEHIGTWYEDKDNDLLLNLGEDYGYDYIPTEEELELHLSQCPDTFTTCDISYNVVDQVVESSMILENLAFDYVEGTGVSGNNIDYKYDDGVAYFNGTTTSTAGMTYFSDYLTENHIIYISSKILNGTTTENSDFYLFNGSTQNNLTDYGETDLFIANDGDRLRLRTYNAETYDSFSVAFVVIDLTDLFGSGNEPTITEFEDTYLVNAPKYFDEYEYNTYVTNDTIIEINSLYEVDNEIVGGDFTGATSKVSGSGFNGSAFTETFNDNWTLTSNTSYQSGGSSNYIYTPFNLSYGEVSYLKFDIDSNDWSNIDFISYEYQECEGDCFSTYRTYIYPTGDTINFSDVFYNDLQKDDVYEGARLVMRVYFVDDNIQNELYIDNYSMIKLANYYGIGNEPTKEEFEAVADLSTWSDTYTYEDDAYMTVEQLSPLYQYDNTQDLDQASFYITLEDSVQGLEVVDPKIVIKKYDLEMNYVGDIYNGYITGYSDIDGDSKWEHNLLYQLPSTTATENGYIYMAYDDEEGGTFLGGGYIYKTVDGDILTPEGDYRGYNEFVTINDSAYLDISNSSQFESDDFDDYIIDTTERFIVHTQYDYVNSYSTLKFYNENTTQFVALPLEEIYEQFIYYDTFSHLEIFYNMVFELSTDDSLPLLLDYIDTNNVVYNNYLYQCKDYYELDFTNIFDNPSYGDNKGVYTYEVVDSSNANLVRGETPLFYMDSFTSFNLPRHLARVGDPFYLDLNLQDEGYLTEVYDTQYIYDTNTLVINTNFDLDTFTVQTILIDIFQGIGIDYGKVQYVFKNTSDDYRNGIAYNEYNIVLEDDYELNTPVGITENVDNLLNDLNFNDTLGKIIIGFVFALALGIIAYLRSKNIAITLLLLFIGLGISFLLGFIPAWIILFMVVIFSLMVWFMRGNSGGE